MLRNSWSAIAIALSSLLAVPACAFEGDLDAVETEATPRLDESPSIRPLAPTNRFLDEVIRELGRDGKLCYWQDGRAMCVSDSRVDPRPIALGDEIDSELYECQRLGSGQLASCAAGDIVPLPPRPQGMKVHCDDESACAQLASIEACQNGCCGCCEEGLCCCDY